MSLAFHFLSPNTPSHSPPSSTIISFFPRNPCFSPRFASNRFPNTLHFQNLKLKLQSPSNFVSIDARQSYSRVSLSGAVGQRDSGVGDFNIDYFLSAAESFCLVSSLIASVGFALNYAFSSSKNVFMAVFGDRIFVGAILFLVAGVAIGAWIRRRQWNRIFRESVKGVLEGNLVERMDKLEEDLRSTATLIRVMSRQLEKLGIRFRVTRKALKKPIEEAAVLAQKTSEVTRTLAAQEDLLEKEIAEIQKMLLAMQEQQQKQLELILAIGKSGKLWESRQEDSQGRGPTGNHSLIDERLDREEVHEM